MSFIDFHTRDVLNGNGTPAFYMTLTSLTGEPTATSGDFFVNNDAADFTTEINAEADQMAGTGLVIGMFDIEEVPHAGWTTDQVQAFRDFLTDLHVIFVARYPAAKIIVYGIPLTQQQRMGEWIASGTSESQVETLMDHDATLGFTRASTDANRTDQRTLAVTAADSWVMQWYAVCPSYYIRSDYTVTECLAPYIEQHSHLLRLGVRLWPIVWFKDSNGAKGFSDLSKIDDLIAALKAHGIKTLVLWKNLAQDKTVADVQSRVARFWVHFSSSISRPHAHHVLNRYKQ